MQRYPRDLEQIALMRDLNKALRKAVGDGHYATMVAVGWHGRRSLMMMTNAGHPPPLLHHPQVSEGVVRPPHPFRRRPARNPTAIARAPPGPRAPARWTPLPAKLVRRRLRAVRRRRARPQCATQATPPRP